MKTKYFLPLIALTLLLGACASKNETKFMKAVKLSQENKPEAALRIYNDILRSDSNFLPAIINRAVIYNQLGEIKMAQDDYNKALKMAPKKVELLNNVGVFYLDQGRAQVAKYYFDQAIDLRSEYTIAYVNRAKANLALKKYDDALQDINIALGLEPSNLDIILMKAIVNYQSFNFMDALDGFSEVLNSRPQDYKTYYRRALAFRMLNAYQNAFEDLNTCLSINGAYIPAIYTRAELLFDQGDYEAALADLDVLKTIDNHYAPAYDFSGDIYAIEDPVKAAANYIVAKKLDPANTKRYNAKIKFMATEKGRKAVLKKRLERI